MKKIAIIGAGPAGLTAAYQLSASLGDQLGQLDVYEYGDNVGGMSRSISLWNQTVDLGPHRFFSKDRRINELWLEVVGDEYDIVSRQTRIFYKKRFFDYPIRAFNALKNLGIFEAARCVFSYMVQKIRPVRDTSTFEGWVTSRFGKRLYTIFFKTYSEKLWGIKCTELDSDFAAQRIKKLSLLEAIINSISLGKRNRHATLVDQFAYPLNGTGSVYGKMKEAIEERGGRVLLKTPVKRVVTKSRKVVGLELEDAQVVQYDEVISTMPMTHLVQGLDNVPEKVISNVNSLSFRNTILVYLLVDRTDLFSDQWLYIHDSEVLTGRITNFRNWVPNLYGAENSSILCMEYWCNFEDPLWSESDEQLKSRAREEIQHIGLVGHEDTLDASIVRIPRCYPVYSSGYQERLNPVQEYLSGIQHLHVIGRYGAFKYNNQDHSILMGILAAENILEQRNHNLWEINTDYDVYQESATITKTGLATESGK